ncbi:MAG TPA: hypothetical protein PK899_09385 [Spirochaetota bacterium]|nr:hypothetical protein [Spirochaetota bacterium]
MNDIYITPKSVLDCIEAKKAKRNEYQWQWYQRHKKQVLAYMKEWRLRNPDKRYGRDSEKNIEYMRKYNKANREKILKDKTDYYYRKKAELLKHATV